MEALLDQIGAPLIAVVVPLVLAGAKWLLPRIPKPAIPYIAVLLGVGFDQAIPYIDSLHSTDPVMAAVYGIIGIGLRELSVQLPPIYRAAKDKMTTGAIVLALALGTTGLSLSACGMIPTASLQEVTPRNAAEAIELAQEIYREASAGIVQASRDGALTVVQLEQIDRVRAQARAAIDVAIAAQGTADADSKAALALSLTRALRAQLIQLSGRSA